MQADPGSDRFGGLSLIWSVLIRRIRLIRGLFLSSA